MIKLTQIEKHYGSNPAIRGVTFQVDSNQIVGLLGPNGAGKTTLIRIITCYHLPTQGKALINNHNVFEQPREVKEQIGYLPENAPLYGEMSVVEYLLFMSSVRNIPLTSRQERLQWVADKCGLNDVLTQSIATLSKGYRQRVGLAQAILHDPPILILDEPTSGLDPNQIIEIRGLIEELGKKKTVILSTHILQEVEALCDKVLILDKGVLVAQGSSAEIASQMKGEVRFSLRVKDSTSRATPKDMKKSLGSLSCVQRIIDIKSRSGASKEHDITVSMHAVDRTDPGEALFDWAVQGGYKIIRLTTSQLKLEDIFTQLTT